METDKLIKALTTTKYRVELVETENAKYIVQYEAKRYGERRMSEPLDDYNTASFMFDLKVDELEGQ